jgi:hypothetical protein
VNVIAGMGARVKLVALTLGALATALPLLLLLALPESQPPGMVERIYLGAPHERDHRLSGSTHPATAGAGQRYGRGDRPRAVTARGRQEAKGTPTPASISTDQGAAREHRTAPDSVPPADSPSAAPRGESLPRGGGPHTPRGTPVPGTPPAPRASPPQGAPPPEPYNPTPAPDEPATSAAVDSPEEPEAADGDPPEEPEAADGEPPT